MRIITVNFSAAADGRALSIDRDTVLSYVAAGINSVVSCDPAATTANRLAAPGDALRNSDIALRSAVGAGQSQITTDFPLSAGESVFVSATGAGFVQLFFTDS